MKITVKSPKGADLLIDLDSQTLSVKTPTTKIDDAKIVSWGMARHNDDNCYSPTISYKGKKCPVVVDISDSDRLFDAHSAFKAAKLENAVPGLKLLQSALYEESRYMGELNDMMDDEANDGVFCPTMPDSDIDALKARYPRAAVYVMADSYSNASHDQKASAGRRAKDLLLSGGDIDVAKDILNNWAKNSFID